MSRPDLTRWNRGGLDRFRYIDGNAATYLDDLRLSLLVRYIPEDVFANEDHLAVSWWKELWSDIPGDESALSDLNVMLSDYRAALAWKDLWQALPTESESREKWIERLTEQYHGERREWAWEIVRSLARATHVLVEHIDAYANEGFLGTATQWDNLRRLVAMLDYHPAPPPDAGIVKVATIEKPDPAGVFRIPAPTGTRTLMVRSAEGELKELTRNEDLDTELNDGLAPPPFRLYLESDPIAERGDEEFHPEFGEFFKVTDTAMEIVYLIDEPQEETEAGVGPVTASAPAGESLMAAPLAAPPPDLPDAEAAFMLEFDGGPGELAGGQWAVGEDRGGGFWPLKIEMIEERDDGFTITAAPAPSTTTIVRLYGAFAGTLRPRGYDINPTPVAGSTLTPADGVDPLLVPGRRLLLEHDPPAEFGMPVEATVQSADPPNGTFTLDRGLTGADGFTVGNTVIRGNVVTAGHGESKPEQVLGSGDAARSNQSFVFEVEDVSFVADPAQSAGVRAAISVVVGNRTYTQVSELANSGPADPSYTVRMTEDGYLRITFGDGRNGRRLETGTSNVRVSSFRVGTGPTGNGIRPGGLTKPVRPHYLVDEVRQPLPSIGGNAMEDVTSLRKNAPAGLLTLGRAVSHGDFARLAAAQSSVWHANAFALTGGHGRREAVDVVVVPAGGGQLGALEESLTAFLSARALPGMDVKVSLYEAVFPDIAIGVRVKSAEYDPEAIVADVRAGLADLLSLRRRRPGQPLYRSEVFEAVESVSGVEISDCIIGGVTAADGAPLERIGRGDNGSIRVACPTQRQVIYLADVAPVPIAYAEFAL